MCPGAGKVVSRRRGKFTFIHYRRKIYKSSRRRGKLCPGAGESCFPAPGKSHIHALSKKMRWFSRRQGKLCTAPESSGARFWKGCGARFRTECNFVVGEAVPGAGKAVSRRRGKVAFIHYRRKMCKFSWRRGKLLFPGAGESFVLAPGNLFPGAGERLARRRLG